MHIIERESIIQRARPILKYAFITLFLATCIMGTLLWWNLETVRRLAVVTLDVGYAMSASQLTPAYPTSPNTELEPIHLTEVLSQLEEPTDLQAIPGTQHEVVVLQKGGQALWANLKTGQSKPLFSVDVVTESEQGLLGLAFSPDFTRTGRFYVDYTRRSKVDHTIIQAFTMTGSIPGGQVTAGPILLEVEQPYQNHNAGQIAFGPDEKLYVSMGDGGYANDPHQNGQNPRSLLGTMLRLDVNTPSYIPVDNPILPGKHSPTAVWAYGLRNPWRFSWDTRGRLIVADVGQNRFEEINLLSAGNFGWDHHDRRRGSPGRFCNDDDVIKEMIATQPKH